jgi:collagenase-like PrtC family protease
MAEELRPEAPFGVQGTNENIWHIASAERWSDGVLIGHRTFCGRNYAEPVSKHDLAELSEVCSDCTAQVTQRH